MNNTNDQHEVWKPVNGYPGYEVSTAKTDPLYQRDRKSGKRTGSANKAGKGGGR